MYVKRHAYVVSGALLLIGAIVCSATWMLGLTRVWYQWGFFNLVITLVLWNTFRHWWERGN